MECLCGKCASALLIGAKIGQDLGMDGRVDAGECKCGDVHSARHSRCDADTLVFVTPPDHYGCHATCQPVGYTILMCVLHFIKLQLCLLHNTCSLDACSKASNAEVRLLAQRGSGVHTASCSKCFTRDLCVGR